MTVILTRWSVADYHRLIATGLLDEKPVELLKGQLVEMSPESPLHADLNRTLADQLRQKLAGKALISEGKPITLTPDSEPEPDIAVVRLGSYRQHHPQATDILLIIEFANSSLAKHTQEKALLYAQQAIADYWVADLANQQLHLYRQPSPSGYQEQQILTEGSIALLAFPEVTLTVTDLLF
ncbi:MAG: Uma2 family endonuclease [Microcystaceae cyanobacterium]